MFVQCDDAPASRNVRQEAAPLDQAPLQGDTASQQLLVVLKPLDKRGLAKTRSGQDQKLQGWKTTP
jgi:hypothetical protein